MVSVPLEGWVTADTWRQLSEAGDMPVEVDIVLTGTLEPPSEGLGTFRLLAFKPSNGETLGSSEAHLDEERAGAAILGAVTEMWKHLGHLEGRLAGLDSLSWDAVESLLLGERCAVRDAQRGGRAHDPFAALSHLERAADDCDSPSLAISRLAVFAEEAAGGADPRFIAAAGRTLERVREATGEAGLALLEAEAILRLRAGEYVLAEAHLLAALGRKETPRLHVLLTRCRRARGDLSEARKSLQRGLEIAPTFAPLLVERGLFELEEGDEVRAEASFLAALGDALDDPQAFLHLAELYMRKRDPVSASGIVDKALAALTAAHPDVLRRAVVLTLNLEEAGVGRAARLARLAEAIIEQTPMDMQARMVLGEALGHLGRTHEGVATYRAIERTIKALPLAAEARRARFALESPEAMREIESVVQAAEKANERGLEVVLLRAQRLASDHHLWLIHLTAAKIARNLGRFGEARAHLEAALADAEGCLAARIEMVEVCLLAGDAPAALAAANVLCEVEGRSPKSLALLARVQHTLGNTEAARESVSEGLRAIRDRPGTFGAEELEALAAKYDEPAPKPSVMMRAWRSLTGR